MKFGFVKSMAVALSGRAFAFAPCPLPRMPNGFSVPEVGTA